MARVKIEGYGQHRTTRRVKGMPTGAEAKPPEQPVPAPQGHPEDVPVEAIVRINVACNQHCFFCNTDHTAENIHEKRDGVLDYISRNRDVLYLSITGGEPTINPNLFRYIRHARAVGIPRVILQTNAMMAAYEAYADKLAAAGLTGAFVSLHAPEARVSDKITRTPGGWDLTVKGLGNLLERGVEIGLNTVINGANYTLLPDHARFVAERFPDLVDITLSYVAPTGYCEVNAKNIPKIADVQPYLFEAIDILVDAGVTVKLPDRCGIPLCTVRGYERYHEALMGLPYSGTGVVTDDHFKHEGCGDCVWNDRCIGYWKKCVELHGHDELVPLTEPVEVEPQAIPYAGMSVAAIRDFLVAENERLRERRPSER